MCIIALGLAIHPAWPLIVATNRDELHSRPWEPLGVWGAPGAILAGRDAVSGGTWLGVSVEGRFAAVSNLRHVGVTRADRTSCGALVVDFLADGTVPDGSSRGSFNPFNLVTIDSGGFRFHSNYPAAHRNVAGRHSRLFKFCLGRHVAQDSEIEKGHRASPLRPGSCRRACL